MTQWTREILVRASIDILSPKSTLSIADDSYLGFAPPIHYVFFMCASSCALVRCASSWAPYHVCLVMSVSPCGPRQTLGGSSSSQADFSSSDGAHQTRRTWRSAHDEAHLTKRTWRSAHDEVHLTRHTWLGAPDEAYQTRRTWRGAHDEAHLTRAHDEAHMKNT